MKSPAQSALLTSVILLSLCGSLNSCKYKKIDLSWIDGGARTLEQDTILPDTSGAVTPIPSTIQTQVLDSKTGGSYTVQPGDTLSGIAKRYDISVAKLCSANKIQPGQSVLRSGQKLNIPARESKPSTAKNNTGKATTHKGKTYTVKAGDTLSGIAQRHKIGTNALLKANNLNHEQAKRIRPGQQLRLP